MTSTLNDLESDDTTRTADSVSTADGTTRGRTQMRRTLEYIRVHWISTWIFSAVVLLGIGYICGLLISSPLDNAKSNSEASVHASARATRMAFEPEIQSGQGTVQKGEQVDTSSISVSAGDMRVTEVNASVGDIVASGSVPLEVAGQPIMLLQLPFALYRDIHIGDSGADVTAIQQELKRLGKLDDSGSGRFDEATHKALSRLVAGSKTKSALGEGLEKGQVVAIPTSEVEVITIPGVGDLLDGGSSSFNLRTSDQAISGRFSLIEADAFSVGENVLIYSIRAPETKYVSKITSIGGFKEANEGEGTVPGYDFKAELRDDAALALAQDDTVNLVPENTDVEAIEALGVPTIAVREDAQGNYVFVAKTESDVGDSQRYDRRAVEVGLQQDGWLQISGGDLADGEIVIIGGSR